MNRTLPIALLTALLAVGCGSSLARVKGHLVANGQPLTVPATTVALEFSPIGEGGKRDASKVYSAVVTPDGSFEVVSSSGQIPPGSYAVAIQATGKLKAQFRGFAPGTSPIRRDIKAGANELTIDVAKPEG